MPPSPPSEPATGVARRLRDAARRLFGAPAGEGPELPLPPVPLRRSVGVEDPRYFENPTGELVFGDAVPAENYRAVLDFGCGCGRIARQMLQQKSSVPDRYLGVDLYKPSIDWCSAQLTPFNPAFVFEHHDFFNAGLNPGGSKQPLPLAGGQAFSFVNAHSVFTHIIEDHVRFYFDEVARALADGGVARISWFMFEKALFPMMQESQNALYINTNDPTNAVIYDIDFVRGLYRGAGLHLYRIEPPAVRGHQWLLYARRGGSGAEPEFPRDTAPLGIVRPPETL